jgi:hypothetical protein
MNDHDAEDLAHAVSNSDDLCLPSNPDKTLRDMQATLAKRFVPGIVEVSQYKPVNLKGYKLGQDGKLIKGRKPKIERNQRVIRFYESGIDPAQIAKWMEMHLTQVHHIIRRGY